MTVSVGCILLGSSESWQLAASGNSFNTNPANASKLVCIQVQVHEANCRDAGNSFDDAWGVSGHAAEFAPEALHFTSPPKTRKPRVLPRCAKLPACSAPPVESVCILPSDLAVGFRSCVAPTQVMARRIDQEEDSRRLMPTGEQPNSKYAASLGIEHLTNRTVARRLKDSNPVSAGTSSNGRQSTRQMAMDDSASILFLPPNCWRPDARTQNQSSHRTAHCMKLATSNQGFSESEHGQTSQEHVMCPAAKLLVPTETLPR